MTRPLLSLIAAVARNGAIGKNNDLVAHIPGDLQRLKRITLGHPVIMGRKTWDSLPTRNRPLPGRLNIVVTRNTAWQAEGAVVAHTLDAALHHAQGADRAYVLGGADLYAAALPMADELLLTEIDRDYDGDVFFPSWRREDFHEVLREPQHAGEPHDVDFAYVTYQRQR